MLIDDYFQVIREMIETCPAVHSSTVPHHKHAGDETNVIAAPASTLVEVLAEVETLLDTSQLTK